MEIGSSPAARRRAGVLTALLRMSRALDGVSREGAGTVGLTPAQAETLRFATRTRPDMATIGQLARVLGVRHATAVDIARRLIERGLIERRAHHWDRRSNVLAPTQAGAQLLRRLDDITVEIDARLEALHTDDLTALERGLGALIDGLRASGALVVAAPCAGCTHFRPDDAPGTAEPHRCALLERHLSESASQMDCPEHDPVGAG